MTDLGNGYDLVVIGGGINGIGIARDAAGRGLAVLVLEKDDLACATSSASTKLIHGGLRYLEQYEIRLVRESLTEREVLLRSAPHIISPLTFLLPHHDRLRPRWMLRAGLFLYDHLAARDILPASGSVDFAQHRAGAALKAEFARGFHYSDCWVDDSRLVVLNALDAKSLGATILTRAPFHGAERRDDGWLVRLHDGGRERTVRARALVNATGPWVEQVRRAALPDRGAAGLPGALPAHRTRQIKGSHIVVRRRLPSPDAFIFQNGDGRIVFAIPYESDFTLIGTTDVPHQGDLTRIVIDEDEVDYLLDSVNGYFAEPVAREAIVWSYAGVRPLHDDGRESASTVTRDYVLDIDSADGGAPLLSVFGGKITTYRKLGEHALGQLLPFLGRDAPEWTAGAQLPGGDLDGHRGREDHARHLMRLHRWLPAHLAERFARSYGSLSHRFLAGARDLADLGQCVAPGLHEAELDYLVAHEWARSADDILWRRSKLGLHMSAQDREAVEMWLSRSSPRCCQTA
jgi:glycerol-3-phosphate dehydrogenase